jgi:hypothetical protein
VRSCGSLIILCNHTVYLHGIYRLNRAQGSSRIDAIPCAMCNVPAAGGTIGAMGTTGRLLDRERALDRPPAQILPISPHNQGQVDVSPRNRDSKLQATVLERCKVSARTRPHARQLQFCKEHFSVTLVKSKASHTDNLVGKRCPLIQRNT